MGRVDAVLWVLAAIIAIGGIAVAVATSSAWPLLAFAGLAVPLLPLGRRRRRGADARSSA